MPKDALGWTKLIWEQAKGGKGREGVRLYKKMREEGVIPIQQTFVAALKACTTIAHVEAVHAHLRSSGHVDIFVASTLVDMYAKCGSIEDARLVFQKMRHRNVVSWNAIITGYAHLDMGASALELYARMHYEGFIPNARTFVAALKACASLAAQEEGRRANGELTVITSLEQGRAIHAEVAKRGLESDIFVGNTLVDMYAKSGSIEDARHVFEHLSCRDVVSWNAIITGYAHMDMGNFALEFYVQMQNNVFIPNDRTFVAALKACASFAAQEEGKRVDNKLLKASYLEQGRAIHTEVVKAGFESDIFVASTLVDMYIKCGSMEDARQLFETMRERNIVSWNSMIMGCAQMGMADSALDLYARIQNEGFLPNARTFIAALKACATWSAQKEGEVANVESKTSFLGQGRAIHAEVARKGFESDIFVANTLVDMYAKCGSIEDAWKIFEKMKHRDVVSWNAMITGYANMEMKDLALELYAQMQHEGFIPDERTFVAALKACASLAAQENSRFDDKLINFLDQGKAIHAEAAKRGFESHTFVANTLLDMYAKCGEIEDACQVFEKMKHRTVVSWNTLILGYAQREMGTLALEFYDRMEYEGFIPDSHTFVAVLKACASLAEQQEDKGAISKHVKASLLEQGRVIHAEVAKRGFESNMFVANTLVDLYAKCGSIDDARQVFDKMMHREVVSWNTMLIGYAQMGMGHLALELYACMQQEGFTPDDRTFVAALNACSGLAGQKEGSGRENEFLKTSSLEQGRAIHAEVAKRRFESDTFVANTLVDMYAKCGSVEDARHVFEKMRHRDVVSWNAMITGYAQMEMGNLALKLYTHMQHEGFIPNASTYVAALLACGCLASLETGTEIHSQIHRVGLQADLSIANCLINMYGKCGSMRDARQIFESLLVRNLAIWNALIAGYSGQGDSECLLDLYKRIQQEGVKPDGFTFIHVLNVCSHNGLVDEGRMYFQAMCLEYGILASDSHYTCMTDLLARAGKLDEAAAMVTKMPFQPEIVTWITILGACQRWNIVETARSTFECVVMLDETLTAAYVLMTNIYVSSSMWEESAKMEAMRMKPQAWKKPWQHRWTDSAGMVHTFFWQGLHTIPR